MMKILRPEGRAKVIKGHSNTLDTMREEKERIILFFWWFEFKVKHSRQSNHSLGVGCLVLRDIKIPFMLHFILAGAWVYSGSEGLR